LNRQLRTGCMAAAALFLAVAASANDNELTPEERKAGWILLFNGKSLDHWMNSDWTAPKKGPENGAINPHGAGAYMVVYEQEWGDFVLALDFKISSHCNSGILFRTSPLKSYPGKDVGYNAIEMQIFDSSEAGFYDTGALYDLVKPSRNAMKPVGEWNHAEITCDRNKIAVRLNGEDVSSMDLDQWTQPFTRPDGSKHKFHFAYKYRPRSGYIGLQDHGADCWFKNIKLKPLR
jgi:hypothetical protein